MTMPSRDHEFVWVDDQDVFPVEIMGSVKYIRADLAEELARALENIARTKYGLQGIMEDYEGEEYERNAKEYYAKLCATYEKAARQSLARFRALTP